jgi:hypothetical protein
MNRPLQPAAWVVPNMPLLTRKRSGTLNMTVINGMEQTPLCLIGSNDGNRFYVSSVK